MAIEVRTLPVTIPAGTAASSPLVTPAVFPARIVTQIDILFPPGPRGEVGIAVGTANIKTLPYGNATYLVADAQFFQFPLEDQIDSGSWQITAYNTGMFPHTVTVTFHCSLIASQTGASQTPGLPPGSISSGDGGGSGAGSTSPPPATAPPPVEPPPVTPPPVVPPGVSAPPLALAPAAPLPPGVAAPAVDPMVETMLVGVPDLGQVWLLDGRDYAQVTTQDDLDALSAVVAVAVNLSQNTHASIYAAAGGTVAVWLGENLLTGRLTVARSGGA